MLFLPSYFSNENIKLIKMIPYFKLFSIFISNKICAMTRDLRVNLGKLMSVKMERLQH